MIFLIIAFSGGVSIAQSKKDQVNLLIKKVDSLSLLINSERSIHTQSVEALNAQLKDKENQIKKLEQQVNMLNKPGSIQGETQQAQFSNAQVKTQKIGKQFWMTENLSVTTFRNGDTIQEAETVEEWVTAGKQGRPVWCYYNNDPVNGAKYGKLYNWYAVCDPRGLAPVGWKIPEFEDFNILDTYLWGEVGTKLKCSSGWKPWNVEERCKVCLSWSDEQKQKKHCTACNDSRIHTSKSNSGNGTNSSGFAALPGGIRNGNGQFEKIGEQCNIWSATSQYSLYGRYRILTSMDADLIMNYAPKDFGMSIRCLKE